MCEDQEQHLEAEVWLLAKAFEETGTVVSQQVIQNSANIEKELRSVFFPGASK